MYAIGSNPAAKKWPMSRLTAKYFDIDIAAEKLSGLANWFGSFRLEWPCMATVILYLSAKGATRFAEVNVEDAVMSLTPSASAIWNPRSISSSLKLSLKL